ncbi:MAG: head GIN domain-containing protein [Parvularculaceae bacterium]
MVRVLAAVAAAAVMSAASEAKDAVSRTYEVQDFSAIEIGGAYELDVAVGGEYSLMLEGPEDEMARAEVSVKNGALVLSSKKHRGDRDGVKATVTMPALERLSVSGVVDADIRGVDAGVFKVNLSGVGEVDVAGRCNTLHARVSGVGELDAKSFECASVDVSLSGMGEASVYARDRAKAEVSGMGEINIYGSPKTVDKRGGFFSEITVH